MGELPGRQDCFQPLEGEALEGLVLIREEHRRGAEDGEECDGSSDESFHYFPIIGKKGAPVRPWGRSDTGPRVQP